MNEKFITLTDDEFYELVHTNTILEVSESAPKSLKNIDKIFRGLRKNIRDILLKKELIKEIQNFTDIKKVTLVIKPDLFNATVLPVYNSSFPKELFGTIKELIGKQHTKNVKAENIKTLDKVEESAKNIDEIIVVFGENLIKNLSPEECTAILLHELGHVFSKTASWPYIIPFMVKKIFYVSATTTTLLKLFGSVPFGVLASITFVSLIGIHGLTFLERLGEYSADNYAAKYGYGDELAAVLYKVKSVKIKIEQRKTFVIKIFSSIVNFIESIFSPHVHPTEDERILNLHKRMTKEFKELYPELESEITYIFNKTISEA